MLLADWQNELLLLLLLLYLCRNNKKVQIWNCPFCTKQSERLFNVKTHIKNKHKAKVELLQKKFDWSTSELAVQCISDKIRSGQTDDLVFTSKTRTCISSGESR